MAKTPEDFSATPDTPGDKGHPGTVDSAPLATRRRAQALAVCIAAAFLTLLDVSIVTVALPSMEHHLALSPAQATWSIAGYTLTFGLALIPSGRLGDEFGRKKVFLVGMVLFTVTGVLCAVATTATWLVVARLARGVAAGLVAPQVVGLLHQMYPPRERGRAFGYYGATVSLSTAIGPLLGGAILQCFGTADGWRWIFLLFIPLDLAVLPPALRLLPESRRAERRSSLDLVGALVLGLAVTAVMLPLLETGGWSGRRWWLAWTGLALLAVFVLWERSVARKARRPLVDLNLFRERAYWVGTLVAAALYGGFTGIFIVLFQFLQQGLHYSPFKASLCTVLFTLGSAACGIISGRLVHRVGRPLVIVGTACTALGLTATALVVGGSEAGDNMFLRMALPLLLAGCGAGLVIAANQTLALHRVPRREGSTAAGVYQTGMKIGTSLGTALASSLYFGQLLASHGDFSAAARTGLLGAAALAAVAFLVALPGLTLRGRRDGEAAVGAVQEVEPVG
ncbi:MFS transporter [Streptomyces sp. GESEQ-35]|uniref:MFS transporter n=1 Tax=Streptomyces sp. GESEQ-35 TaxID=2812657 RepID=UPI001B338031|nr:MFS transporter [Streptomyces sp. GESEQ-35]